MAAAKTITIHLDYDTWKEYSNVKNDAGMTWTGIIEDWFKQHKQGETK